MNTVFALALECLFPSRCVVCGTMLADRKSAWYSLCGNCRRAFILEQEERCGLCGRPLISETEFCLPCRGAAGEAPSYDRLVSLFPYTGIYHRLLGAFKFGKSPGAGRFLAEKLNEAVDILRPETSGESALVPVPPRPGKIRKNGWDQIEHLARILEREKNTALPVRRCLRRSTSETQKKLDREKRLANLKGRISARGKVPETAVLFDDVITTGSTMEACARALKAAGTGRVYGICLFYD